MNPIIVAEPNPAERSTGSLLLDRLWQAARKRGDSQPTANRLINWTRYSILFHNKRHPSQLGLREAVHFLEHVVKTAREPLPTLAQARSALALLYGGTLGIDLGELPWPRPSRVLECCSLRVHDIDLARARILVRAGKGNKDRVVMLPRSVRPKGKGCAQLQDSL